MLDKVAENTVFRKYNNSVIIAFFLIVFIALLVASMHYYNELSEYKKLGWKQLTTQTNQLNSSLIRNKKTILGIQKFAQYLLKYPDEFHSKLPPLKQEGPLFLLDNDTQNSSEESKHISKKIIGLGEIDDFSLFKKQEIAMANSLTAAFVSAQKVTDEKNHFYYVSVEKFVNIFPWNVRDNLPFSNSIFTSNHVKNIQALGLESNKVLWLPSFTAERADDSNISLGIGVYRKKEMIGSIIIDVNLARLKKNLSELVSETQSLILLNKDNDILIFEQKGIKTLGQPLSLNKHLPEELKHLSSQGFGHLPDSVQIGDWFVEKRILPVNGWTLLKFQPYSSYTSPIRNQFIFMFILLFIGLFSFLMIVNAMTRRTLIKPTREFITHIENCVRGDSGTEKMAKDWLHWFVLIEGVFNQNRSLLLQCKEKNEVLDSRVLLKTKALQDNSAKHQRDYVLLRSVMNAIPELIIFNDPDGNLMGCNKAFEKLSGNLESAMLGGQASKFMPKLLAHEIDSLNETFQNKYPQQALIETGNESYQGFCNQFTNEQGEIIGTITILQDVTEQQATQSDLEQAKDQAEYANQIKIQFLANMSHEIRTPINAIQGMMSLLAKTLLDSRQQHYLVNAQTAAFSLLHLIDELLDLSKIEAGKMILVKELIDLPSVIDKALKLNSTSIHKKKLNLRVELAANVPRFFMSDEMRLVQVLSNLLNNAIKFTMQGEVVLVIEVIGLSDINALVRFKVKDTGIGISKDNQKNLFEAFSQADISMTRKYGGSGLGLSICQQIVKLLGGEIKLKSDLGLGCEFNFILPLSIPSKDIVEKSGINITAHNTESAINFCTIQQELSTSCIDTIKHLSWNYYQFDHFVELKKELSNKTLPEGKIVLLINEETLSHYKTNVESSEFNWHKNVDLVGICQPTMQGVSSNACKQLDEMKVPYILLDMPLYRYALEEVAKFLSYSQEEHNKQVLIERSIKASKSSVLIHENQDNNKKELSNINILLAEDNLVNQLVAKELLMSMKAKVTIADNGQKVLDLLDEKVFDVVLMDIQMPIMDGLAATEEIRKNEKYQKLPIIAMTAHAREEDKQRSLAAGMNLHIAKPITAELLYTNIKKALDPSNIN